MTTRQFKRTRNTRNSFKHPVELKFVDTQTNADAFSVTWDTMEDATNDSVSGVALGDSESQRDGRVYYIHNINIRARVHASSSESQVTPQSNLVGRFCLVWDTQTNGTQLTATDVMDGGQTDDVLSFANLQNSQRFRILWDKSFILKRSITNEGAINLFATPDDTSGIFIFNRSFKRPIKVVCTGTDATISSISDNSLHIIGVANNTAILLNMQIRVRFTS